MVDTAPSTAVYVSNAGNKEIHVLAMNRESGELGLIDKVPVPGNDQPSPTSMPLAVTPDHRYLYAAVRSEPFSVSSFAIDRETGRLRHLSVAPLAASMAYIVTDRTGGFLLGASYPGAQLTINPIDENGQVLGRTTQIIPDKPKAHCISRRRGQQICLRDEPRRRRGHGMEIRPGRRHLVAQRARRDSQQARCGAAAHSAPP
jgi:6-phosphogluconolactonase